MTPSALIDTDGVDLRFVFAKPIWNVKEVLEKSYLVEDALRLQFFN